MIVKTLNLYVRPEGGFTVSLEDLGFERLKTMYRLIADEGMGLSYNEIEGVRVVDVEDPTGWVEAPLPPHVEQDAETDEIVPSPLIENEENISSENPYALSPAEYLEWVDYKSRLSTLEYKMSMLLNAMKAMQDET